MPVLQHKKRLNELKQRHAEMTEVRKETAGENVDSLINDVKFAKSVSVKMCVE